MNDEIRAQLYKMTFVLALLAGLGIWQLEFVVNAINANIMLNMTIFGTFAFGVYAAYRNVFGLRNEVVAYEALKEDYQDIVHGKAQDEADPFWRYYRCEEDAVIFAPPKILAQPYQIISEEIARTRNLSVSTGVMQNLLDSIDERLDEQRSLIQYVTGLLVFLGLIGTFVGLMVTLGSVGAIIGGLDLSGGAGAAAIQGLMDDLKIPLQGMATGFSSSLFGLITSLTLGLMGRFANQASGGLKSAFATWLAGVAKVDGEAANSTAAGTSGAFSAQGERMLSIMYRVAKLSLVSNARVVSSMESMSQTSSAVLESQIAAHDEVRNVANAVLKMTDSQMLTSESIREMAGLLESRQELEEMVEQLRVDAQRQQSNQESLTQTLDVLATKHAELQARAAANEEQFARRDDVEWLVANTQQHLNGEFTKLHGSVEQIDTALADVNRELGYNARALKTTNMDLAELARSVHEQLDQAIGDSREAIRRADEREAELRDQSVEDMHRRLIEQFGEPVADDNTDSQKPTGEKRLFGLLRRRA